MQVKGGPGSGNDLENKRWTVGIRRDETRFEITDDWKIRDVAHRLLPFEWKGHTWFFKKVAREFEVQKVNKSTDAFLSALENAQGSLESSSQTLLPNVCTGLGNETVRQQHKQYNTTRTDVTTPTMAAAIDLNECRLAMDKSQSEKGMVMQAVVSEGETPVTLDAVMKTAVVEGEKSVRLKQSGKRLQWADVVDSD